MTAPEAPTVPSITVDELEALLDEQGFDAESKAKVITWLDRGDGVAVYQNEDLGHPGIGTYQIVSFGSLQCQLGEIDFPPSTLPDIGGSINWRFQLQSVVPPKSKLPRQVWIAVPNQIVDGKFVACLVTEGEAGYRPALGKGACAQPWFLTADDDFDRAQANAAEWTLRDFGLDAEAVAEVKLSSFRAQVGR